MSTDPAFRMTVEDTFSIRDRGTVVTSKIESGMLNVGDEIEIQRPGYTKKTFVTAIEAFRKQLDRAQVGDNVGLLLRDISKQDIQHGDLLVAVDSDFRWKA